MTLVGHTDPRGTQEYNLALSERRAQSVRDHLGRLGVDGTKLSVLPRGSLDAKGTDEPSWAQDRRVDFTWQLADRVRPRWPSLSAAGPGAPRRPA